MAIALDQFVRRLADSGLLTEADVQAFVNALPEAQQPADGEQLARLLVKHKKLTAYQAQEVYKGAGKGLVLGNYVVLDKLGQGGMGMVLKAEHKRMKRQVALKVLSPSVTKTPEALLRFQREVEAAAKLRHPNIVAADDADEAGGIHFLVMEYVEGTDLSALVKKVGPLPVEKALSCIVQAARGLEFAHQEGVIHRDIKPANLLLDNKGNVKILDMGLARFEASAAGGGQADLTGTGQIMGTVDYMAPEQAMNTKNADQRADIYSLGISLWYLVTGKAAYDGETLMEKLMAHQTKPIPSLREVCPQVSQALDTVFAKMIAKTPAERYQSMTEVVAELERCRTGETSSPAIVSRVSEESRLSDFLKGVNTSPTSVEAVPTILGEQTAVAAMEATAILPSTQTDTNPQTNQTLAAMRPATHANTLPDAGAVPQASASLASKGASRSSRQWLPLAIPAGGLAGVLLVALGIWLIVRDKGGKDVGRMNVPDGGSATDLHRGDGIKPSKTAHTPYEILTSPDYEWTPPENLGLGVNTAQAEKFAALSADGLRLIYLSYGKGGGSLCEATRADVTKPFGVGVSLGREFGNKSAAQGVALSGDGLTLVFGSERSGGLDKPDLYQATRPSLTSRFGKPIGLTALNSSTWDSDPSLTPDGLTVRFKSPRPNKLNGDYWTSRRSSLAAEFEPPVPFALQLVPGAKNYSTISGITGSADDRVLIFAPYFEKGVPTALYMSVRPTPETPFGPPVNLGPTINGETSVQHPNLSADGTILVFSSTRPGGVGDFDLWMTRRVPKAKKLTPYEILTSPDYEWSPSENLGPGVNTDAAEGHPALSADGLRLIYCRHDSTHPSSLFESTRSSLSEPFGPGIPLGREFRSAFPFFGAALSGDDLTLVFGIGRPDGRGHTDLCQATRPTLAGPFSKPVKLAVLNSHHDARYPILSSDGLSIWFKSASRPDSLKGDMWTSRRSSLIAEFEKPVPFPFPVAPVGKSWVSVSGAAISSDQRVLVISGSFEKDGPKDLFLSVRTTPQAHFGTPVSLGPAVNDEATETYATLSADGSMLLFSSDRSGGCGNTDLWMTRRVPKAGAAAVSPPLAKAPFDAKQALEHQEAWAKHLGVPVEFSNSLGMKFRLIPPGEFVMGIMPQQLAAFRKIIPDDMGAPNPGLSSATPERRVRITKPYYMQVDQVGRSLYTNVLGREPAEAKLDGGDFLWRGVNWHDAIEFCNKLGERDKRDVAYAVSATQTRLVPGAVGYRLPTEAEFEFACRAGTETLFYFGSDPALLRDHTRQSAGDKVSANPFGLFDFYGGTMNWCWDSTPREFGPYPAELLKQTNDPVGLEGPDRILRGGKFFASGGLDASQNNSFHRNAMPADLRGGGLGRIVLTISNRPAVPAPSATTSAPPPAIAPFDAKQARAHQEAWARHLGTTVETTNSVGAKMVLIPPGEFLMGSTDEQVAAALKAADEMKADQVVKNNIQNAERPQHKVVLTKPILMGATEVTVGQYKKFIAATGYQTEAEKAEIAAKAAQSVKADQPSPTPIPTYLNPGYAATDDSPASVLTWNDAVAYCKWLSEQEKTTYRLPTEAEWECASRAGSTTQYSFGDDYQQLEHYGWYRKNKTGGAHEVGKKLPNGFGLFDMNGNLGEWCGDFYDEKWYEKTSSSDPNGPATGSVRVVRDGNFTYFASLCRSAYRNGISATIRSYNLGFRVVRVLDATATKPVASQPTVPTAAPPVTKPTGPVPPPAKAPFDATQAKAHQATWARHLGTTVETTNSVGAKMVLIPPGEFLMGTSEEQVAAAQKIATDNNVDKNISNRIARTERPQHKVVLTRPFAMSATEVTIGQFKRFSASGYRTEAEKEARNAEAPTYLNPGYTVTDDSPVSLVTWYDAVAYCEWLCKQEKAIYRLPTEAEWEYACRAGTTTLYFFGDDVELLDQYGWYSTNSGGRPHPVSKKMPNGFGLFDMYGNMQEWCGEFYDEKWYEKSPLNDPAAPPTSSTRAMRGGLCLTGSARSRSGFRNDGAPSIRDTTLGFRVVREFDVSRSTVSPAP